MCTVCHIFYNFESLVTAKSHDGVGEEVGRRLIAAGVHCRRRGMSEAVAEEGQPVSSHQMWVAFGVVCDSVLAPFPKAAQHVMRGAFGFATIFSGWMLMSAAAVALSSGCRRRRRRLRRESEDRQTPLKGGRAIA